MRNYPHFPGQAWLPLLIFVVYNALFIPQLAEHSLFVTCLWLDLNAGLLARLYWKGPHFMRHKVALLYLMGLLLALALAAGLGYLISGQWNLTQTLVLVLIGGLAGFLGSRCLRKIFSDQA